jgi:NAD(P)-dependent dehydrogenase (short-subunit alcohol dehydrogenase family)
MNTQFDLTGQTILVVGGRGYLGRQFCITLESLGASVHSADIAASSKSAGLAGASSNASTVVQHDIDVRDAKSVRSVVARVLEAHGQIDTLVYSVTAKPDDFYEAFTECSLSGWKDVLSAELDGLFLCAQEVGRHMEKRKAGSMVLLSSIYGVVGNDQRLYEGSNLAQVYGDKKRGRTYSHAAYPAAKGGVIALARYLAAYWGHLGIRVNCVSPGGVGHPKVNDTFVQKYSEKVPMGRMGAPEDVTGAVSFLASEASSYVTGQNIVVDGGFTSW